MFSIIIVEDDFMQREILKKTIISMHKFVKVYEADSERTALDIIEKSNINLFLIDIGLKESCGLELAMNIRRIPKYEFSQLVFLTTHVDYMLQAFKQIHCYDYILKPYSKNDVQAMLNKLIDKEVNNLSNEKDDSNKELVIRIGTSIFIRVKIHNILFIEVKGRDCEVNTVSGVYTYTNISLKKILRLIDCEYIVQSHKSFAVNKNYIFKIEKLDVKIGNLYFKGYSKTALMGYKFKSNIIDEFKQVGNYYVK